MTVRIWYIQKSKDTLLDEMFTLNFWNLKGVNKYGSSAPGLRVSWLNPLTGRWEASNNVADRNCNQSLDLSGAVSVKPGKWAHVDVRISFGSSAPLGTWHFEPLIPNSYNLKNSKGQIDSGFLRYSTHLFAITVTK